MQSPALRSLQTSIHSAVQPIDRTHRIVRPRLRSQFDRMRTGPYVRRPSVALSSAGYPFLRSDIYQVIDYS